MTNQFQDSDDSGSSADPKATQASDFAIRRQLLQMEMLYEIGLAISQSLDPAYVAQEVLKRALVMVDARGAVLLTKERPEADPQIIGQVGLEDTVDEAATVLAEPQVRHAWDTGQLTRVERPSAVLRYICIVPLASQQGVEGLLVVADKEHRGHISPFSPSDETLLQSFAHQAGNALLNARLHHRLEEAYEHMRQSQKMEALGQLAGGIAHDFNNLLSLIMGYSQLGLEDLDQEDPLHDPLTEIQAAGERAAALTHQLLAFSRKEVLQPEVIDLNEVVDDMSKMLLRLIGDVVELQVVLEAKPAAVRADRNRLEQVIMNLTVNARDAMQQGGVLRVQTENIEVAQTDPAHPNLQAGRYVLLSYVDNGKGMDADTMAQVFEPFFTTKPPGRGTGMGLAMVHGIVKQSGGHIQVASQVGDGTTFCIYLPQLQVAEDNTDTATNSARMPRGRETVLLVDNEAGVRKMVRLFLEDLGYHVLGAGDTDEAIAQFDQHGGVDLLLADVIVPGIGITQLVAHLAALQPGLQVLYLSGHPDAVLERHGVDPITAELVHKPINKIDLARRVREVLDEGMIFEVEE